MNDKKHLFVSVDDERIATAIASARKRVVIAAPGLGKLTGEALAKAIGRLPNQVTVILDADAETCRIGYGDPEALRVLEEAAKQWPFTLRRQPGLRIGVLIVDDSVLIWSPIARSVEAECGPEQPNGLALSGDITESCATAMGANGTSIQDADAEIGRNRLSAKELNDMVEDLERNPPVPFDLARRVRVFSSRFRFVEFEIRGAQWTERKLNLSSLPLNADLSEELQNLLDTQIHPYQEKNEPSFLVPHLVAGIRTFDRAGRRINVLATQGQVLKYWMEIRDRYLRHLPGFGWLIKRDELPAFLEAREAFEETLRAWVEEFRKHAQGKEESLVEEIVKAIRARLSRSNLQAKLKNLDLQAEVRKGLDRMRMIEPHVRIVIKDVAWESTRDEEFQKTLERTLSAEDLKGWFEEFTAARERTSERGIL